MVITGKSKSAIKTAVGLAKRFPGVVRASDLSNQEKLSISYIEQILTSLRQNNLVSGVRGPGGGYKLTRSPSDISVEEILTAVNGKSEKQPLFIKLGEAQKKAFSSISIGQLI